MATGRRSLRQDPRTSRHDRRSGVLRRTDDPTTRGSDVGRGDVGVGHRDARGPVRQVLALPDRRNIVPARRRDQIRVGRPDGYRVLEGPPKQFAVETARDPLSHPRQQRCNVPVHSEGSDQPPRSPARTATTDISSVPAAGSSVDAYQRADSTPRAIDHATKRSNGTPSASASKA